MLFFVKKFGCLKTTQSEKKLNILTKYIGAEKIKKIKINKKVSHLWFNHYLIIFYDNLISQVTYQLSLSLRIIIKYHLRTLVEELQRTEKDTR